MHNIVEWKRHLFQRLCHLVPIEPNANEISNSNSRSERKNHRGGEKIERKHGARWRFNGRKLLSIREAVKFVRQDASRWRVSFPNEDASSSTGCASVRRVSAHDIEYSKSI